MKEKAFGSLILTSVLLFVSSCSVSETYTLKEAGGFELEEVVNAKVSRSVYQSLAWDVDIETYSVLDCLYTKTDFDIDQTFLNNSNARSVKEDAYTLHVTLKSNDGLVFYISHSDRYIYFNGIESTYKSKDKVSYNFINDKLLAR